jgi:hypothetical protein
MVEDFCSYTRILLLWTAAQWSEQHDGHVLVRRFWEAMEIIVGSTKSFEPVILSVDGR